MKDIDQHDKWYELARLAIAGKRLSARDGLGILSADDAAVPALLGAAYAVRHEFFGNRVRLCMLINAQCGLCSEDCAYCAQAKGSQAHIDKYALVSQAAILERARAAMAAGAINFSIVTSGRGPSDKLVETIAAAVREIKATLRLQVCASLGILTPEQAKCLAAAGLDRYHHNLNTSARFHPQICTTHTYEDRVQTVRAVQAAGLSSCAGVIVGMGETDEDIVDMALALRDLDVDSIPVNFLIPVQGTPLASKQELTPLRCLRILVLFRLLCPRQDLRLAGGRPLHLRSLQPLALYAASAMFTGDLLTTGGPSVEADRQMIVDLGFEVEGP